MSRSLTDRIMHASAVVICAHILYKGVGYIWLLVLGHYYPTVQAEGYLIAQEMLFMFFFIVEESVGPAFLPLFLGECNQGREKEAWGFANGLLIVQLGLLIVVTALFMMQSELLIKSLNYLSTGDFVCVKEKSLFARDVLFYIAPGLIGLAMGSTTYMILNGYKRFFWAAFGDSLTKIALIVCVFLLVRVDPILALGLGVTLGGCAKLAGHLWGMRDKLRMLLTTRPIVRSATMRKFLVLIAPLLIGIVLAKMRDFVNNIVVLNKIQTDGLIQANYYGGKLAKAFSSFVPYAISIAMFPFFCDLIDKDDRETLGKFLTDATKVLLLFFVPLAAGGALLSYPMVRLLYEHGEFAVADWTAVANIIYLLILPFMALETFYMQGFFADRRTVTPIAIGIVSSALSILISYLVVMVLEVDVQYGPVFGIIGVAGGYAVSRILKVAALTVFLRRKIPLFRSKDLLRFFGQLLLATLAMAGIAWLVMRGFNLMWGEIRADRRILLAAQIGCSSCLGAGAFFGIVWALKMPEFRRAIEWTIGKMKRKRTGENTADS